MKAQAYFNKYYPLIKSYTEAGINPNDNKHAMAVVHDLLGEFVIEMQEAIKINKIHTGKGINVIVDDFDKRWKELCQLFDESDTNGILVLNKYTFRGMVNSIVAHGRAGRGS